MNTATIAESELSVPTPEPPPPRPTGARVRVEPVSPFVVWTPEDRAPIPDTLIRGPDHASLLVDILRSPRSVVTRLLDPDQLQSTILGALVVISAGTAFFSSVLLAGMDASLAEMARASALLPFNMLLAAASALGPIYAASILCAARLPMPRLVATILTSLATGVIILAATSPLPYLLWKIDPVWAGPLSVLACFAVSAIISGARLRQSLREMALFVLRASTGEPALALSENDAHRVGILSRVALFIIAFTTALSFWAFDAVG